MSAAPKRADIQALRAIAVLLVVGYHLWPSRLPGGFIGVDVFFVISGLLMTSQLLRESDASGSLSVTAFWARRARRLLPASLTVLTAVVLATVLLVPDTFWQRYLREAVASAAYVQNWVLAGDAVDYLAAVNSASPVQHFWSLSVEEQFYLLWPLILLVGLFAARRAAVPRRRMLLVVTVSITALSFATSIVWTAVLPASAYFVTPTRIWELGIGAILAFVPAAALRQRPALRAAAAWAGLAAIVVTAFVFSGQTPFPGVAALLPVIATAVVLVAAAEPVALGPLRAMGWAPLQFVGNISYSLYLWHWPLIVLVPLVLGVPLTTLGALAILLASLVLAWLSYRFIENRFRARRPAVGRKRTLAVAAAGTAALVLLSFGGMGLVQYRIAASAAAVEADTSRCFGAAAMDEGSECDDPFAASGEMTPAFAKIDVNWTPDPAGGVRCQTPQGSVAARTCVLGETEHPSRTVAMLGDSHSMHFLPAITALADRYDWRIITYFKSSCSGTGAGDVVVPGLERDQAACAEWGSAALKDIESDPEISTVIFSNVSGFYTRAAEPIGTGPYLDAFGGLTAAGINVLVIADVPHAAGPDTPDCIARSRGDESLCDLAAAEALPHDAAAAAADQWPDDSVRLLDLTSKFCRDATCHARVGGVIVYSDSAHLTRTFARTLTPYLDDALRGW